MSISANREISQFGSFLHVDNSNKNIGITTTELPFVGIGTIEPIAKLDVRGTVNISDKLIVDNVEITPGIITSSVGIITYYGDGSKLIGIPTSGNSTQWVNSVSGIYTSSNVGVGTEDPTSSLYVVGDVFVTGIISAINVDGYGSGIAAYSVSSGVATYSSTSGVSSYSSISGVATYSSTSGISTSVIGGIGSLTQLTVGNVEINSGIITATTGIITYYGDGSKLTGISIGGGGDSLWVSSATGIHTLTNVGIGTTNSEGYQLNVNGSGNITTNSFKINNLEFGNSNSNNLVIGNNSLPNSPSIANNNIFIGNYSGYQSGSPSETINIGKNTSKDIYDNSNSVIIGNNAGVGRTGILVEYSNPRLQIVQSTSILSDTGMKVVYIGDYPIIIRRSASTGFVDNVYFYPTNESSFGKNLSPGQEFTFSGSLWSGGVNGVDDVILRIKESSYIYSDSPGNNGCVFIGNHAGNECIGSTGNTYIGNFAGESGGNDSYYNTFIGSYSGTSFNIGGFSNVLIGSFAGQDMIYGFYNTFIGSYSAENYLGIDDTIGVNYDSGGNVTLGTRSARYLYAGSYNTYLGAFSGPSSAFLPSLPQYVHSSNTAVGSWAGNTLRRGQGNTFLGAYSGGSYYDGSDNICIGAFNHDSTVGYNLGNINSRYHISIGIGLGKTNQSTNYYDAERPFVVPQINKDRQFAVGIATTTSGAYPDYWLVGNENFNIGIGTTNPTSKLTVGGDVSIVGVVTATTFSGNCTSATYASTAGIATYASTAGIATYASTAGSLFFDASEFIPSTTSGCGIDSNETAVNYVNRDLLAFDSASIERATKWFTWPDGWGTAKATFYWYSTSGIGTVMFTAELSTFTDGDSIDKSWGTAQSVVDTVGAASTHRQTDATPAITPSGIVTSGKLTALRISRDPTNVSDTLAVDALVMGVLLERAG